jgi:DNA polymerase-3 subunit delta
MVAVKAHQAQAFLKAPEGRFSAYLLYGTDPGLVSERAHVLAKLIASRDNPPGEIVRLDDIDLENDPDRLSLELLMMPMFGGRKIVRVSTGRRINAATLKPLVEDKAMAGILIVEAGNLKPDESLRTTFEKAQHAAAIACYGDEDKDLDSVIREVLQANGLAITSSARQLLISRLGADRVMSRGEIEKLALYAYGAREITEDDVDAVVGDAAELTIDRLTQASAAGDRERAVTELQRALAAGESAQGIILAIQRHFTRLHRIRASVENGRTIEAAIGEIRPPIHFKQKDALTAQCRVWRAESLDKALAGIAATARAARASSALEDLLAERLILTLAGLARESTRAAR